jgi:hypothetical protein
MMRSRAWALTWALLRFAMAALIAAAIIAQLVDSVAKAQEYGRDIPTTWANFFSFFTILSNTLSVVVLAWAAIWYLTRGRRGGIEPVSLSIALASVSTYMIITGVVYNTLLRSIPLTPATEPVPWSNEILHLVGPLFLALDVLFGSPRRALRWRAVWAVLAFPIVWVVYTMIRGPLVTDPGGSPDYWYPYPFLNPNNFDNGYGGVAVYIVGIAVGIIAVASLVVWVGRLRGDRAVDDRAATAEALRTEQS